MELTIDQALQKGITAHKEGDLETAERLYRAILKSQPRHPHANHNLGVLALSLNKGASALPLLELALKTSPRVEQFWLSYIDALITMNKVDEAERVLADAEQKNIDKLKLVELRELFEQQVASLRHVPSPVGNSSLYSHDSKLSPAIELREAGKYKEAQECLRKLLRKDPKNAGALSLLSQVFLLDRKEEEASKALAKAESIEPELPAVLINQARLFLKQSKKAEAMEKAQLCSTRSPDNLECLLVLAACLIANDRDSESLTVIGKILKSNSSYAEAYANRALIKSRYKDTAGAIKDAKTAVLLKPHLTHIWQLLSSLHYQCGHKDDAIQAMQSALDIEPENTALMIQLGKLFGADNRPNEASIILERATKLSPNDTSAWSNFGIALQQEKNQTGAKKAYERALLLNPNLGGVSCNLGVIAKDEGDFTSALRYFQKALESDISLVEAHNNLGIIYQELDRLDEAEGSFRQAIAYKLTAI